MCFAAMTAGLSLAGAAHATCTTYPYTLTNGSVADATQVMANFNCAALLGGASFTGPVGIEDSGSPSDVLDVYGPEVLGAGTERLSLNSGSLGFNRRVATGQIFNTSAYAYQFQHIPSLTNTSDILELQIYNPSGTAITDNALAVNAAGSVGIGTSTPTSTLQVHGTFLVDGQVQLTGGGAAGVIVGKQNQAGSVSLARASDGSLQGFFGYASAAESSNFTFDSNGGGGYLTFANGASTERMRIAVGGNVGIGTTTPAYLLDVAGSIRTTQALLNSSAAPTISTCGTSPPTATSGSNNNSGQFTLGTGSTAACTVTFANAFPTAAFCTLTPASAYTGTYYISAQSASAFTVTLGTGTASVKFNYTCGGT